MSGGTLERISRETGRGLVECSCEKCKAQCRNPCLGTPGDILRLIRAGYKDRLALTFWAVGMLHGEMNYPILMVQAIRSGGYCTFFRDGLCELHELGLKPTEGKLSHHTITEENFIFTKGLPWQVAKEWIKYDNSKTIIKVLENYK